MISGKPLRKPINLAPFCHCDAGYMTQRRRASPLMYEHLIFCLWGQYSTYRTVMQTKVFTGLLLNCSHHSFALDLQRRRFITRIATTSHFF
jgi:hypothetical protein